MSKKQASEVSRVIAGQLSKSEKRERAARSIMQSRINAHQAVKQFHQAQLLNK